MIKLLQHTRRPDIAFNRNGRIRISARVTRLMSILPGDVINIAEDIDKITGRKEYLLVVTHSVIGRHEAQCYENKKGSKHLVANSVRLAKAMLDISQSNSDTVSFMIGQPVQKGSAIYLPIITANPL